MNRWSLFAAILATGFLAVGVLAAVPVDNSAWAGAKSRESGRNYVLESERRVRRSRIPLPIGPSYIYYDYPYYYSRGYYPTHIGGYVYYPSFRRARSPRYASRCSSQRCVVQAGSSRGHVSRRQRRVCRCL